MHRSRSIAFRFVWSFALAAAFTAAPALAQDFADPQVLSRVVRPSGNGDDVTPSIAKDAAGRLVAVWSSTEPLDGSSTVDPYADKDVVVSRSTDGGVTWSYPELLHANAGSDTYDDEKPQIVHDGAGAWVVVWRSRDSLGGTIGTDHDVLISRSTDGGVTWSAAKALNPNAATDFGFSDDHPRIAAAGSDMVATWNCSVGGATGNDDEIFVSRSSDSGVTWTAAQPLNTDAASDTNRWDEHASVTSLGDGVWIAAWHHQALSDWDSELLFARSTDNGATWTAPAALPTDSMAETGRDEEVELAADGDNVVAVWESTGRFGPDYDVTVARSSDGGASWSAPAALPSYSATDTFGLDRNARVATDGAGAWTATWTTNYQNDMSTGPDLDVFVARSDDGGASWSVAERLSNPSADSTDDDEAALVFHDGAWIAVWSSRDTLGGQLGQDSDILMSRTTDGGDTWSATAWLNVNAPEDAIDALPDLATDGDVWITVWYSQDGFEGQLGRDGDIFFSRSTDGGASWSAAAPLNPDAAGDSRSDVLPRIATVGSSWVVVWSAYEGHAYYSRSTDDGATWSAPALLSGSATYDQYPSIASDGSSLLAVWSRYEPGPDFDLYFALSTDGGASWTEPAPLQTNAGTDSGVDVTPDAAWDGAAWIVAWTSSDTLAGSIGTDYDVLFARSADGGSTWSAPAALDANAATDSDHDVEPQLASDGSGNVVAAWSRYASDGGSVGDPAGIVAARSADGGETWSAVQSLHGAGMSPALAGVSVATDGAGNWAAVFSAKESAGGSLGSDGDLMIARSSDAGANWSVPDALLDHAASDSGADGMPVIATDRSGTWVVAFASTDAFGGLSNAGAVNIFATVASLCDGCDDGNPCTQDSCGAEGCVHLAGPALDCRLGTKASLAFADRDDDTKDSLQWKLSNAASSTQADFGDPTATAAYTLCIYDGSGTRARLDIPGGALCDGVPCWSSLSASGYRYKDKLASNDGVSAVLLKGSSKGKTKTQLKGAGAELVLPSLPLSGDVAVQLHNSDTGLCWGSSFAGADILQNDSGTGVFQAKVK